MTPPVNNLHALLRNCDVSAAISVIEARVQQYGYNAMFHDPGVRAWVEENQNVLRAVAAQRRAAREGLRV